jgi:hypothetical protein
MNTYRRSMAVRPPQQDGDEPESLEFGIAALDARLSEVDLSFPAAADDVVRALDNAEIPYDASGNSVAIEEALSNVPHSEFESESQLLDVLHPVFEEYRQSTSGSILGQLRALLPF